MKRHNTLMDQITELQVDLAKTVSMCRTLRDQNEVLKSNYDRLKADHIKGRGNFAELQKQYDDIIKEKENCESNHADITQILNNQLAEQVSNLNELRSKLPPPRKEELMRLKIQEEVSVKHKEHLLAIKTEKEKYQEQSFSMQHKYELLKSEFEEFTMHKDIELATQQESHRATVEELQQQIQSVRKKANSMGWPERLRSMQGKIDDLNVQNRMLSVELEEITSNRDEIYVQSQTTKLETARKLAEFEAQTKSSSSQKRMAEKKAEASDSINAKLHLQLKSSLQQVSDFEDRIRTLQIRCEDLEMKRKRERDTFDTKLMDERAAGNKQKKMLNQHINTLKSERLELKLQLQSCKESLLQQKEAFRLQASVAKSNAQKRIEKSEQLNTKIRLEEESIIQQLADLRHDAHDQITRLQAECNEIRSDARKKINERDILIQKLRNGDCDKNQNEDMNTSNVEGGKKNSETQKSKNGNENRISELEIALKEVRALAKRTLLKAHKRVESSERRTTKLKKELKRVKVSAAKKKVEHEKMKKSYNIRIKHYTQQIHDLEQFKAKQSIIQPPIGEIHSGTDTKTSEIPEIPVKTTNSIDSKVKHILEKNKLNAAELSGHLENLKKMSLPVVCDLEESK